MQRNFLAPYLMNSNCFLFVIVKIKANVKLAYVSLFCALTSNIIKYTSFQYYIYKQYIHLISITLLQNDQTENIFEKAKRNLFLFCRIRDIY